MEISLNLKSLIAPSFHELFDRIDDNEYMHYWLAGGRGSTKSTFASIMAFWTILSTNLAYLKNEICPVELGNVICLRKVASTLRNSVWAQLKWAMGALECSHLFYVSESTHEMTFRPTGQKIILAGVDDHQKLKSIKVKVGYIKMVWFEELSEFSGMEEIRSINQSVIRGGNNFTCIYSYNPPITQANWVNFESEKNVKNRYVHKSTYLDVPKEWLGEAFLVEAETLKATNELAYRHEYLGEITGTGGTVFANVVSREITDEEIKTFDRLKQGIDWGYSVDPFSWGEFYYDKTRRTLYVLDEIYGINLFNTNVIEMLNKRGRAKYVTITADCAEPKSIAEFRASGFNIYPATKGSGSVAFGIKWLQSLREIIIDQKRTPNAWQEFMLYEYEKNKDGTFKSDYPDKNNHFIDCTRYALEPAMQKRGLF